MTELLKRTYPADAYQQLLTAGFAPLLARIFAARSISSASQLDTGLSRLLPFTQLKNSREIARILADIIEQKKKILIVADYDADGATACAVAMRGLHLFGARVDFIVPNRFEYGYGLTPEIVQLAAQSHPDFLLTVDNGIASVEGVAEANRLGMQVLVTDHHLPGDALPDALCIVNPNQPGCEFPSKNLAGVGVMFYVLLALRAELRERGAFTTQAEPNLANLLDLVALGTVADVVKLDENNRILVQQGLQRIRAERACCGIGALFKITKKQQMKASAYELGFIVGPRLNAAGRLEDMGLGIRCLLTDNASEAGEVAAKLDALNQERRSIEADMQEVALAALEEINPSDGYSLSLFDESWHQGVIGILASRLKDRFHRPVITFARSKEGELKGSGRSIHGLHLRDALDLVAKRHPHLLQKFGGHAMAAGVTIREVHFAEFQNAFENVTQTLLTPADLVKVIETDGELAPGDFSLDIARTLEQQVWGQGFPEPLFQGNFQVKAQRVVGEKHLKLKLAATEPIPIQTFPLKGKEQTRKAPLSPTSLDAMHFFSTETLPDQIHAVFSINPNEYNGVESLQLIVRHWRAIP